MDQERSGASFAAQANALMRKSLVFQKRRWITNLLLVLFPLFLCILLLVMQIVVNNENNKPKNKCGCFCVPVNGSSDGVCNTVCGVQYSTQQQALTCPVDSPSELPAMVQVPEPQYRAVNLGGEFPGFPDISCRNSQSCPFVFLYTAQNRSLADALVNNLITDKTPSNLQNPLSTFVPGTSEDVPKSFFLEPALPSSYSLLSRNCTSSNFSSAQPGIPCVSTVMLWRNASQQVEQEIYKSYKKANPEENVNGIPLAYNFHDTSSQKLDVTIFYNSTFRGDVVNNDDSPLLRVARSMNLAAEAFVRTLLGSSAELPLSFMKEMPKLETKLFINFTVLLGPIFYMWVVQLLFPVVLISLVYEKEQNLRMMMRMHGLGDGAYWFITYSYYLIFSLIYIVFFMVSGSAVGLDFFRQNDFSLQFVFYFVYMNLQIALAFLATALFSRAMTATVCGYLYVFGFGLLGGFLFQNYVEDTTISRSVVFALELFPGFSLFRGLYEFSEYAFVGASRGGKGMRWGNLGDSENGLLNVLLIMTVEWLVFLPLSLYLDQVLASGSGLKKNPFFFLDKLRLKSSSGTGRVLGSNDSDLDKPDVAHEKTVVEGIRNTSNQDYAIVCDELKKIYPGRDGNPDKVAVRSLSLAIRHGECFGMLGPNGAGKTTSINMMIGFLSPSSGKALVAGLDICKDMDKIYTIMGVCPQHDLLWESLTGREHLLFYGRLKNLKGAALESAVETSLKNVNLFDEGVGNKLAGKYSGGMKRRLSVAVSLIGQTKAVYMDEPSTGLDPASRRTLWDAIKRAKQDRAIILTTHSMEEAEALCDRVGIFVNGQLQCIGSCRELKTRYGGSYVFTVTADPSKEEAVANLVGNWSSSARRVYNLSGTQKFEISKEEVKLARVFRDVEKFKTPFRITAWGLTDTTLEDVFIKVASD